MHDRVVAVVEQLLAHGIGVVAIGEWSDLHVNQIVLRLAARRDGIATLAQRAHQHVRVFGVRDGRNLHHRSPAPAQRRLHLAIRGGWLRPAGVGWRSPA